MSIEAGTVNIISIACTLSHLRAFTHASKAPETLLCHSEPFGLEVTVEFAKPGAIALVPLSLPMQIDFFAKPYGCGSDLELGTVTAVTQAGQFSYALTLEIPGGPAQAGLVSEKIYAVSALLRIGAPQYPALINGFIEKLIIQTYEA